MQIEVNIPEQDIIDALVGAFEGGSNYWYLLPDLTMLPEMDGKYSISERITMSAMDGESIPVHDVENKEDLLGYISKENIERGVKLYHEEYGSLIADDMDASDSDVLLQYIVMGEIVYG